MDVLDRMGNHGHHPEEEHLERYVMKTSSEQETEDVEVHLLVCEPCRARLHEAEEWVLLMKSALPLGPQRLKSPPWRFNFGLLFSRPALLAGCGAMAVALCAGSFLLRDPPAAEERVHLYAMRGAPSEAISQASSHHRLILRLDTSGLSGPMEAQIVDAIGTPIFSSPVSGPSPEVKLERTLSSGLYWVRINSAADGHRTLRESGLNVH